jgi:hypothetical protein
MEDDCNTNLSLHNAKTEEKTRQEIFHPLIYLLGCTTISGLVSQQPTRVVDRRGTNALTRFTTFNRFALHKSCTSERDTRCNVSRGLMIERSRDRYGRKEPLLPTLRKPFPPQLGFIYYISLLLLPVSKI